ncbi:hypothetical protein BCR43DRAFT_497616 [Syncephalastrum racemosum]|uniref:C2H2-type domain-containing protein n=1 Tax=Syncephalastrum racemosum TaxID=13706 RepID=A0A1X2H2G5_SYNRA|nr:hypothetical protein BCR43DRAFT_497616 [Syncephalastrum racemosum]
MDILELINVESQRNENKQHQCTIPNCSKVFGRRSDLVRHFRIHTNERPYVCDEDGCGKSFIQRSALKVHIRTHSGERPHVCEQPDCGKSFSDSSSLARHRRIHTGRRPYKCRQEGCNKSFARKTVLTKHQKLAHGSTPKRPMLQWRPFEVAEVKRAQAESNAVVTTTANNSASSVASNTGARRYSSSSTSSTALCSPQTPTASVPNSPPISVSWSGSSSQGKPLPDILEVPPSPVPSLAAASPIDPSPAFYSPVYQHQRIDSQNQQQPFAQTMMPWRRDSGIAFDYAHSFEKPILPPPLFYDQHNSVAGNTSKRHQPEQRQQQYHEYHHHSQHQDHQAPYFATAHVAQTTQHPSFFDIVF